MKYAICINKNSFPAADYQTGKNLFDDALQGILALNDGSDKFVFYLDSNKETLFEFIISPELTVQSFIDHHDDPDMQQFLYEAEDQSPALDNLSEEQIGEMAKYQFYRTEYAQCAYPDVYSLAWMISGIMLSIASDASWNNNFIDVSRADADGRPIVDELSIPLRNIASLSTGQFHHSQLHATESLDTMIFPHLITQDCRDWILGLIDENRSIVRDKLRLAKDRGFQGGEPLFKSLQDGVNEIRFNAFTGGAIRILFKHLNNNKYALLYGFIKKSDNEGYDIALKRSKELYKTIEAENSI